MAKGTVLVTTRKIETVYQPGENAHNKAEDAVQDYRDSLAGLDDLDDDQIVVILHGVPGKGDAVEAARLQALTDANASEGEEEEEGATDTVVKPPSAAEPERAAAWDIGKLFPTAMSDYMTATADKQEEVTGSVLYIADFIGKTPELRAKLDDPEHPVPGTRHDAKPGEKKYPGNVKPDYYKHESTAGKTVTGSVFADIFAGSDAGRYMHDIKGVLSRKAKKETIAGDQDLWDALPNENRWSELDKDVAILKAATIRWNNRINNSVSRLRTAQTFRLQKMRLKDYPQIGVWLIGGNNLEVAGRKKSPIKISYTVAGEEPANSEPTSIGTFNRLDIGHAAKLAEAEGVLMNIAHLKATVKRKPLTPEEKAKAKGANPIPTRPTPAQSLDMFGGLANYFDTGADVFPKNMTDLAAKLKTSETDIESVGDVILVLHNQLWPLIQKDYEQIKADQQSEMEQGNKRTPAIVEKVKASMAARNG